MPSTVASLVFLRDVLIGGGLCLLGVAYFAMEWPDISVWPLFLFCGGLIVTLKVVAYPFRKAGLRDIWAAYTGAVTLGPRTKVLSRMGKVPLVLTVVCAAPLTLQSLGETRFRGILFGASVPLAVGVAFEVLAMISWTTDKLGPSQSGGEML